MAPTGRHGDDPRQRDHRQPGRAAEHRPERARHMPERPVPVRASARAAGSTTGATLTLIDSRVSDNQAGGTVTSDAEGGGILSGGAEPDPAPQRRSRDNRAVGSRAERPLRRGRRHLRQRAGRCTIDGGAVTENAGPAERAPTLGTGRHQRACRRNPSQRGHDGHDPRQPDRAQRRQRRQPRRRRHRLRGRGQQRRRARGARQRHERQPRRGHGRRTVRQRLRGLGRARPEPGGDRARSAGCG